MARGGFGRLTWAGLPVIATVARLVCRMARENTWGYKRVHGELKKLGIKRAKSCIGDILRRNGLPPSPEGKGLTWRGLLARHANALLCADPFTLPWSHCLCPRSCHGPAM